MVISHKFKYLFVELPITGTTAIAKELIANYNGENLLRKHSTYDQFLRIATEEEKKYFVFSCIRNPMDRVVSQFIKYKTDQEVPRSKNIRRQIIKLFTLRKYRYIKKNDPEFSEYFKKFYKMPYDDMSSLRHENFDFLIRFENLQNDFKAVIDKMNIEFIRPIPEANITKGKKKNFIEYYTPDIEKRAQRVFSILMQKWNYSFPDSWKNYQIKLTDKIFYKLMHWPKKLLWNLLK